MCMTAIKEVNKHINNIIIRHCYFVEYVKLLPRGLTSYCLETDSLRRRVVKGWAPEMISKYI